MKSVAVARQRRYTANFGYNLKANQLYYLVVRDSQPEIIDRERILFYVSGYSSFK